MAAPLRASSALSRVVGRSSPRATFTRALLAVGVLNRLLSARTVNRRRRHCTAERSAEHSANVNRWRLSTVGERNKTVFAAAASDVNGCARARGASAMELPRRTFLHLAAGAAALPAFSRAAWAQSYPARPVRVMVGYPAGYRSEEHTSELQSRFGISYAVFCLKKKK